MATLSESAPAGTAITNSRAGHDEPARPVSGTPLCRTSMRVAVTSTACVSGPAVTTIVARCVPHVIESAVTVTSTAAVAPGASVPAAGLARIQATLSAALHEI